LGYFFNIEVLASRSEANTNAGGSIDALAGRIEMNTSGAL
jgi:hypothetical protein